MLVLSQTNNHAPDTIASGRLRSYQLSRAAGLAVIRAMTSKSIIKFRLLHITALFFFFFAKLAFPMDQVNEQATRSIFEFDRDTDLNWSVVNDGVMGGRSAGYIAIEAGTLRFTGTLVTQGGGFTSVRARRDSDLSDATGLELLVRGSGRQFEIEVDDGLVYFGRSVSRRTTFASSADWTLIRVPFSSLQSSIFGQRVNVAPINLSRIVGVGIYIADGQDGDFSLEVDHIRAYTD